VDWSLAIFAAIASTLPEVSMRYVSVIIIAISCSSRHQKPSWRQLVMWYNEYSNLCNEFFPAI
jgi:hypothetical protein